MRVAGCVLSVVLVSLVGWSCVEARSECGERKCTYHSTSDGVEYHYSLDPMLCSDHDLVSATFENDPGHLFYARLCGTVSAECYPPSWNASMLSGAAMVQWGAAQVCPPKQCKDAEGNDVCCTRKCQYLGTGDPVFSLLDEDNPSGGGLRMVFPAVEAISGQESDCELGSDGVYPPFNLEYQVQCDPGYIIFETTYSVHFNKTACKYTAYFSSPFACAAEGLQAGWLLVLTFMALVLAYIVVGVACKAAIRRKWALPHRRFWKAFWKHALIGGQLVCTCYRYDPFKKKTKKPKRTDRAGDRSYGATERSRSTGSRRGSRSRHPSPSPARDVADTRRSDSRSDSGSKPRARPGPGPESSSSSRLRGSRIGSSVPVQRSRSEE